jgi:mannose-6-phosphate isomerase-like protein (cupin superfamily)
MTVITQQRAIAMEPRILDAKEAAKENMSFRKVLYTSDRTQLVVMSLLPGEEIGMETHNADQLLYAVKGDGIAVVNGAKESFEKGAIFCVPAGAPHNVMNTGEQPLKLFTIYAPPQHAPGTIHQTKAEAESAKPHEVISVAAF